MLWKRFNYIAVAYMTRKEHETFQQAVHFETEDFWMIAKKQKLEPLKQSGTW